MRSNDSIHYYEHHAQTIAAQPPSSDRLVLAPFLEILTPGCRVLDLGCGVGNDLLFFAQAGYQAEGFEVSPQLAKVANDRGANVQAKNFLFWTPLEGEWDGIWANHSIDHLTPEEAQRLVAIAFKGLAQGGTLGIVVSEGASPYEDRGQDISGPSRWIHPYTEKQLGSMIEQTGFKVLRVGRRKTELESEMLVIAQRV